MKEYKVMVSIYARNRAELKEKLEKANINEIEWWIDTTGEDKMQKCKHKGR